MLLNFLVFFRISCQNKQSSSEMGPRHSNGTDPNPMPSTVDASTRPTEQCSGPVGPHINGARRV
jgi:hypothetical protein